jgi:hypothetical protein
MQIQVWIRLVAKCSDTKNPIFTFINGLLYTKVYKHKVVSTHFNDDICGIEIIYLQERLHVLVNILAWAAWSDGAATSSQLLYRL